MQENQQDGNLRPHRCAAQNASTAIPIATTDSHQRKIRCTFSFDLLAAAAASDSLSFFSKTRFQLRMRSYRILKPMAKKIRPSPSRATGNLVGGTREKIKRAAPIANSVRGKRWSSVNVTEPKSAIWRKSYPYSLVIDKGSFHASPPAFGSPLPQMRGAWRHVSR
jgi:hypothetical protein